MASPGRFPELTVQGRPVEMGRQIGEHFRSMIRKLTDLALERANKNLEKTVSWDAAIGTAQNSLAITVKHFPDSLMELKGTAEGAGVSLERLMVLNVRNMLSEQPDGCTSIIVSAGAGIATVTAARPRFVPLVFTHASILGARPWRWATIMSRGVQTGPGAR